jgi:hypothetical protein
MKYRLLNQVRWLSITLAGTAVTLTSCVVPAGIGGGNGGSYNNGTSSTSTDGGVSSGNGAHANGNGSSTSASTPGAASSAPSVLAVTPNSSPPAPIKPNDRDRTRAAAPDPSNVGKVNGANISVNGATSATGSNTRVQQVPGAAKVGAQSVKAGSVATTTKAEDAKKASNGVKAEAPKDATALKGP